VAAVRLANDQDTAPAVAMPVAVAPLSVVARISSLAIISASTPTSDFLIRPSTRFIATLYRIIG
jgi:hypothetical protein